MSKITLAPNASGTGTLTVAAPNTNSDYTLTLPAETGTVITTGSTAGVSQAMLASGVAGNGPAFCAARITSAQSISSSTWTKVQLNGETFDTASCFDSTTNYRFTPNVAGYYFLSATITVGGSSITRALMAFYKNGGEYYVGSDVPSNINRITSSALVYMNGSTDYIELYGYIIATSPNFSDGNSVTQLNGCSMQGFLARAA